VGVAFDGNIIKMFSPDDNSLGGTMNTITFSFRTFSSQGTILYYINSALTDYLAVELRNGVPWFFFDAGSGPAVIQPDLGGADVAFNDGAWHSVNATQNGRTGNIVVDGTYSGTNESSGTDQVISSRQVLHVGGIPQGAPRSSARGRGNPAATLGGRSFAGCLFGVTINNQVLDFEGSSVSIGDSIIQDIPGCPINLVPGWAFLGGGYLAFPEGTVDNTRFSWSLDIRTTHSEGVLLFVHASDASTLALELRASVLRLSLVSTESNQTLDVGDTGICDGGWHSILVDRSQDEVFVSVDGRGGSLFLSNPNTTFSSSVFIGGVPMGSMAYDIARSADVNVYAPFSGCTRTPPGGLIVGGVTTSMLLPSSHRFVRFDGCPSLSSSLPGACGSPWVSLSAGNSMQFSDVGLGSWTGRCGIFNCCMNMECG
jgi:laminin alpha 1/2